MFQGESAITLDDKGRLALPTAYRELIAKSCGNRLVFTYNPFESGCLWLFPYMEWESVRDQVNALSSVKRVHRDLQLKLVGAASVVEPDGNGRVLLPASLRSIVQIEKKAVLLGMNDKFELWSETGHLAMSREPIREDQETEEMRALKH